MLLRQLDEIPNVALEQHIPYSVIADLIRKHSLGFRYVFIIYLRNDNKLVIILILMKKQWELKGATE